MGGSKPRSGRRLRCAAGEGRGLQDDLTFDAADGSRSRIFAWRLLQERRCMCSSNVIVLAQGWYAYGYGDASQHQQQEAPVSADALLQKALMVRGRSTAPHCV